MQYLEPIKKLIGSFVMLPGIGQKTAERFVFYMLKKNNKKFFIEFANNLINIGKQIQRCQICHNYSIKNTCPVCQNNKRDKTKICLVARAEDILYLEKTNYYDGLYHVLDGLIEPTKGITPDKLNIENLLKRLEKNNITEIIFGLNPTIEGETTIIYLKKIIGQKYKKITLSRLSRGLPMGGDLEYADEITLSSALKNRSKI